MKKIRSVILTVIVCLSIITITELAMAGVNRFCPEVYQNFDFYLFNPWQIFSFILVLPLVLLEKMRISNFKVKNFLMGVFQYGILLVLFSVVYIIAPIIWIKKWGWLYIGTTVYFDFIKKNILYCLIVGISEEFIYRGVVLNLLFKNFSIDKRKDRMIACFCSALIFGIAHATGFLSGGDTFEMVELIITAFLLGLFFAAVYMRTNNIFSVMFLHALSNYALNCNYCTQGTPQSYFINDNVDIVNVVVTIILFIQGIIMLWKDKNEPQIAVEAPELQDAKEA